MQINALHSWDEGNEVMRGWISCNCELFYWQDDRKGGAKW